MWAKFEQKWKWSNCGEGYKSAGFRRFGKTPGAGGMQGNAAYDKDCRTGLVCCKSQCRFIDGCYRQRTDPIYFKSVKLAFVMYCISMRVLQCAGRICHKWIL